MAANDEVITPQIDDDISHEALERVGEVISKIEKANNKRL